MIGSSLDDPRWDTILNEMTWEEMEQFVDGASHNPAISEIGKPDTGDSDGPSKFQIMWFCGGPIVAATFNIELAKLQGDCVGEEAHFSNNTYGWAGPGVNIHRSPFGGRNFEYYSADPFLTGRIAGRVVAGATDKGVYCFFKHFAVNDQEKHREGVACFLTEQALREIYLKPFQMCIQEGKSRGIMSSYNRLGLMETAASYPLLTEVLRNEWGFKGSIISDMTHHSNSSHNRNCYENINNRLLAGCNQQLDGSSFSSDMNATWDAELGCPTFKHEGDIYESYSWWYAVRTMAQQCIWMNARSSKYVSSFTSPLEGLVISGANEMNQYVVRSGEDIDIEISLPDEYKEQTISSAEMSIDPFTPLPEGLTFADNHITGKVEGVANKSIHVLVDMNLGDGTTATAGNSFELIVLANTPDDGEKEESKKGCFGSATALSSMFIALMAAGVGTLLLKRRKED